jgi:leucyl aminopeptidase (aminopeptidase T)
MAKLKWICFFVPILFLLIENCEIRASEKKQQAIRSMFEVNLGVKKNERILVFTDDFTSKVTEEAKLVAKIGESFGEVTFVKYSRTGGHGVEPPKTVWEKAFGKNILRQIEEKKMMKKIVDKRITEEELETVKEIVRVNKQDTVNVVIALAWFSTSHTNFRKLLTDCAGVRYASMPAFDPIMWETAMSANWEEVSRRTLGLKERLQDAMSAKVRTPNGTDVFFSFKERKFEADTGMLNQPGGFGNLPAGELYIAPMEGNSIGKMVIEPGINPYMKEQLVLDVKDGKVIGMKGDSRFTSYLEDTFRKYPLARNIAEFGIGTNEKAVPGSTPVEFEKILGTIHIAIGDNSTIGGKVAVPLHMDFMFEKPTVEITFSDGKTTEIMKDGKLLLGI